jgi:hypothetical protein
MQKEKDCTPQEMVATEAGGLLYAGPGKSSGPDIDSYQDCFCLPFLWANKERNPRYRAL